MNQQKQDQLLNDLLDRVDADRLMRTVGEIAAYVRLPATPAEDQVFRYLQETLTGLGLAVRMRRESAYVSLPRRAALTVDGKRIDCTTHSMLPSVVSLTAPLSYIAPAQLRTQPADSLRGKILLTEGLAMAATVQTAAALGASGVVFITGKYIHEMIVSNVWGSPTPETAQQYPTLPAVSISADSGVLLKKAAHPAAPVAVMTTEVESMWVDLPLLTADLICDTSPYYLLLTGHVDSWHYGAMDNASGNAAALEIARLLSAHRNQLRRGVKFVFWSGHSHGRYAGSTAFCDTNFADLCRHCFLHINADCLGGEGANVLTQAACMAETKELGAAALRKVTGAALEGVRFGGSCDQSFWGTGTPSLFSGVSEQPLPLQNDAASAAFNLLFGGGKTGGFGWWWHTTADTPDHIDPKNLKRDCQIYLAAVYMACAAKIIPFRLSAAVAELEETLQQYSRAAEPALDFSAVLHSIRQLQTSVEQIEHQKSSQPTPRWIDAYHLFIIRLEQLLIPLNYVKGSIYHHDPAIRQPPIPLLEEISDLSGAKDNPTRQKLLVLLQRRLNQVQHQIEQANELAHAFLNAAAVK